MLRMLAALVLLAHCGGEDHSPVAFLTLNGMTVLTRARPHPLADPIIGDGRRMFSGAHMRDERAHKREWRFDTVPMKIEEAMALRAMIKGEGDLWAFDEAAIADALFSGKVLGALASPVAVATLRPGVGADAATSGDDAKFTAATNAGAIAMDEGATNDSAVGDTQGDQAFWSMTDGTATDTSTHKYVGTGSVLLDFDATVNSTRGGAVRNLGALATSTQYAASCYVKLTAAGGGGETDARFHLASNGTPVTGSNVVKTLVLNEWVRVENILVTADGSSTSVSLHVEEDTIDSGMAFAIDAIQIETNDYSTSYIAALSTRAAGRLDYDGTYMSKAVAGATINAWVRNTQANAQISPTIARFGDASAGTKQRMVLFGRRASGNLQLEVRASSTVSSIESTHSWDGSWHMVTGVFRQKPADGTSHLELYRDGVSVQTGTIAAADLPDFSDTDEIFVGYQGTSGQGYWAGPIDDLQVLPYPASADEIAAWFARATPAVTIPLLEAAGDFLEENALLVHSRVDGSRIVGEDDGTGTWLNNKVVVSFTLLEL